MFTTTNGYPQNLVTSVFRKVKQNIEETPQTEEEDLNDQSSDPEVFMLKLPYAGEAGESIIKSLKSTLRRNLPNNQECRIIQTGTKLSKRFNIKDKVAGKHLCNFIYHHKCKNKKCKEDYIGETARRRNVRTTEHGGKDKQSWVFKHSSSTKHPRAKDENFTILATNYENKRKRKLAEAMYIRDMKPSLNKQKESYRLALFA